ncbi:MAG: flagellar basal body L-ring protein FlgH [Alphaproteobacteria bacterium]|nr:flagellar basal body L-ring protein FlgH [Alphaproteobacteria bacterium]
MRRPLAVLLLAVPLAGCGSQLAEIGRAPKLTPVEPTATARAEPSLAAPGLEAAPATPAASASLWRTGARALYHDQRASRIGDILTVRIRIADRASLDNSTSRSRGGSESVGAPNVLGLESKLSKILPNAVDPSKLLSTESASKSTGAGNTTRQETIETSVAAVVTQVLPNGNLVIRGRQEVRVNFELRELLVAGIVRLSDISRDNSIDHNQIAEARIAYGGRGQLTTAQQARWGQQVIDAISPF